MPLLPLCYSTHKSSFCEEERVQRWPSFSLSSSTGGENGCVPKGFNQKHAGCRETSGVFCCERGCEGSGFGVQGCGGGFAEILRLRSQLFWHSLSHIRRFSPLRMTKRGDARLRIILAPSSGRGRRAKRGGVGIPACENTASRANLRPFGAPPSKGRRENRGVC